MTSILQKPCQGGQTNSPILSTARGALQTGSLFHAYSHLNGSLAGVSDIVNGRPLRDAVVRLGGTLAAAQDLVRHVDAGAAPALRRLPAISAELQDALAQVKELTASLSAGSRGNGKLDRDLDLALGQVAEAALSVRTVADLLSRHPEALIRGRASRTTE